MTAIAMVSHGDVCCVECREYNIALRTEMKRREINTAEPQRAAELAAYFTHAKLEPYHTALALGSAMRIFAKLKNYNSCATFCRRLLELNSTQKVWEYSAMLHGIWTNTMHSYCLNSSKISFLLVVLMSVTGWVMISDISFDTLQMSDSARQMLAVCERNPSDAVQLNYDPRNPFDLCSITFTPIYRYFQMPP